MLLLVCSRADAAAAPRDGFPLRQTCTAHIFSEQRSLAYSVSHCAAASAALAVLRLELDEDIWRA
jgi:hypothetical protein